MTKLAIDLTAIQELKDILEDEFDVLIDTYIDDTANKLKQLQTAIAAQDADQVRKLAHSIKGASMNIGLMAFSDVCQQLEDAAKAGETGQFAKLAEPLFDTSDDLFNQLKAL